MMLFANHVSKALAAHVGGDAELLLDTDMLAGATEDSRMDLYRKVWMWLDSQNMASVSSEVRDLTREVSENVFLVVPLNPLAHPYIISDDLRDWGLATDDKVVAPAESHRDTTPRAARRTGGRHPDALVRERTGQYPGVA